MSEDADCPTAFICHATADQERFVEHFARQLHQGNGIEVFYSDWDLKFGDSLTRKILGSVGEEGAIERADFFLIVLSENSRDSEWIREELGQALVQDIDNQCTIIPVVIEPDDIDVPTVLKDRYWVTIPDLENFEKQVDELARRISGVSEKPPLGTPPAYVAADSVEFSASFTEIDELVLTELCRFLYDNEETFFKVQLVDELKERFGELDLDKEAVGESIEFLDEEYALDVGWHTGFTAYQRAGLIEVRIPTLRTFLSSRRDVDLDDASRRVGSMIQNEGYTDMTELVDDAPLHPTVTAFVLEEFDRRGYIALSHHFNGAIISPKNRLKRALRQ